MADCHFHYSTKFAVKCVGCETAILKQFVEMNRNGKDECWHPECYMISKFWNVRLASKNFNTPSNSAVNSTVSLLEITPANAESRTSPSSDFAITPAELKDRQEKMEIKVQQIWHVLSGYEESSAALIGEMLRAVNNQQLLEIILLAEKFILHVEVLFAVIDDLEAQFALAGVKGKHPSCILTDIRHVTRTRSQAIMPKASQPILHDVADRAGYRIAHQQHRAFHPHYPACPLSQDPHSNHVDRFHQARAGLP